MAPARLTPLAWHPPGGGSSGISIARVRLGLPAASLAPTAELLPAPMRSVMGRYVRARDREAFLLGRLALRELLRERGHGEDRLQELVAGPGGKPMLPGVELNISHSGDFVLCAVSDVGPVGIDVEQVRPLDIDELSRFFSPAQWRSVVGAADPQRQFFALWTTLESVLKAAGVGLSTAMATVELEGETARLDGCSWHVRELAVDPGYAAHLATRDPDPALELRSLPLDSLVATRACLVGPAPEG
jgi:4'-phosphopantetheinyl transferase